MCCNQAELQASYRRVRRRGERLRLYNRDGGVPILVMLHSRQLNVP